jgi:hypothetical protein
LPVLTISSSGIWRLMSPNARAAATWPILVSALARSGKTAASPAR